MPTYSQKDEQTNITLVWDGSQYIRGFAEDGLEVTAWKLNVANQDHAERSIAYHIAVGHYPLSPYSDGEIEESWGEE